MNLPLFPFVSQAFSTGTVVVSVAQGDLGSWTLFLRRCLLRTFLFVEGNNYSLKTPSLFPCCLPGLLSAVMNVSSLQNIRGISIFFFRPLEVTLCRCAGGQFSVTVLARPWGPSPCHFPYGYWFIAFSLDLLATGRDEGSGVQRVPQNASFQVSKLHL